MAGTSPAATPPSALRAGDPCGRSAGAATVAGLSGCEAGASGAGVDSAERPAAPGGAAWASRGATAGCRVSGVSGTLPAGTGASATGPTAGNVVSAGTTSRERTWAPASARACGSTGTASVVVESGAGGGSVVVPVGRATARLRVGVGAGAGAGSVDPVFVPGSGVGETGRSRVVVFEPVGTGVASDGSLVGVGL